MRSARLFIKKIKQNPEYFYIIHYSCQNLNDDNEGLSPRITSIAVAHYGSDQIVSFSTHAVAEELGFSRDQVSNNFDPIEKELLEQFYRFVRDRRDRFWIHWNMRNATYGFEHLAHRYRVLTSNDAPSIPPETRINLSDILKDRYGDRYVAHPRLQNLMQINGGQHRDFMKGDDEVKAFADGRYMELHKSTLSKVGFFRMVVSRLLSGKLRVASNSVGVTIDRLLESRTAKVIALLAAVIGIASAGLSFL